MISQERDNSNTEKRHRFDFINRRTFLKLSAAFVAVLAVSRYFKQIVAGSPPGSPEDDDNTLNEEWIATSCLNCST